MDLLRPPQNLTFIQYNSLGVLGGIIYSGIGSCFYLGLLHKRNSDVSNIKVVGMERYSEEVLLGGKEKKKGMWRLAWVLRLRRSVVRRMRRCRAGGLD